MGGWVLCPTQADLAEVIYQLEVMEAGLEAVDSLLLERVRQLQPGVLLGKEAEDYQKGVELTRVWRRDIYIPEQEERTVW